MIRYYFDIQDGERHVRDDEGNEFLDFQAARAMAIGVLPNIARDELPDGNRRDFIVDMRDGDGRYVFTATLSLIARDLH